MNLLLAIIYIAFISLGLPDALLGSAWPTMHGDFQVPVSYAGIVSMIISGGTIVSSLYSDKLTKWLGTGKVTACSVALTAGALLGFSAAPSFGVLCVLAIPYGLGAGAVDAALNNYVALHFKASHMSWLHCFWGIGATLGPYLMGACLTGGLTWNSGYRMISYLQIGLTILLFFSLPLWKSRTEVRNGQNFPEQNFGILNLLRFRGAKAALTAFFCYCALEQTAGLWAASYMVMIRGIEVDQAAKWASLFYLGITAGRFFSGFAAWKLSDRQMVRLGQLLVLGGVGMLLFPGGKELLCGGLVTIGIGCAPIYPSMLHATPKNFGEDRSQAIMGMQMACAYLGSTLMPPIFGAIAQRIGMEGYPLYLLTILAVMFAAAECLNRLTQPDRKHHG